MIIEVKVDIGIGEFNYIRNIIVSKVFKYSNSFFKLDLKKLKVKSYDYYFKLERNFVNLSICVI